MQKYTRLILAAGVIAIIATAHFMATMTFGYENIAPLHKEHPETIVSETPGVEDLSVGYSHPPKLGENTEATNTGNATTVSSSSSLQQSSSASIKQPAPVSSPTNTLNSSSTSLNSVPMPAGFKFEMPSVKVDISTAHL